jgi:RNA polymerase primary sigma factor
MPSPSSSGSVAFQGRSEAKRPKSVEFVRDTDSLAAYFNDIKGLKKLRLSEEQALAVRIRNGDNQAVKALVEANLKFVVSVCRNYRHQGLPMGDLVNEGNLGLLRAARRFDGSMNFKFISYAVWWIRQGILSALAEQSRVLNLSTGKVGAIQRIRKTTLKLAQTSGRQPLPGEVAEEMGITEKEVDDCLYLAAPTLSLSHPVGGEEETPFEDSLPDTHGARPDESARRWVVARNVENLLEPLLEREGEIIRLFYGLGLDNALTMREIADRFGITRERVRQIKEIALRKLRLPSRAMRFAALRN